MDVPGATATTINGINNQGRIVGFFVDAAGNTVGFYVNVHTTTLPSGAARGQLAQVSAM